MSEKKKNASTTARQRIAKLERKVQTLVNTVESHKKVIIMLGQAATVGFNLEKILRNKGIITDTDNEIIKAMHNEANQEEDSESRVDNTASNNS